MRFYTCFFVFVLMLAGCAPVDIAEAALPSDNGPAQVQFAQGEPLDSALQALGVQSTDTATAVVSTSHKLARWTLREGCCYRFSDNARPNRPR